MYSGIPSVQNGYADMDIKSLQYLMGHSDAGVTMNVYTYAMYDCAEDITATFSGIGV